MVDLAEVLDKYYPDLAKQVRDPTTLLLPLARRPKKVRAPSLDKSYGELVRKNVAAGLQVLSPEKGVWRHAGRVLKGGGFAVLKDAAEDRTISDLPIN